MHLKFIATHKCMQVNVCFSFPFMAYCFTFLYVKLVLISKCCARLLYMSIPWIKLLSLTNNVLPSLPLLETMLSRMCSEIGEMPQRLGAPFKSTST